MNESVMTIFASCSNHRKREIKKTPVERTSKNQKQNATSSTTANCHAGYTSLTL